MSADQLLGFRVVLAVPVVFRHYAAADLRKVLYRAQRDSNLLGGRYDPVDCVLVKRIFLASFFEVLCYPRTRCCDGNRSAEHVNLRVALTFIRPCVNTSSLRLQRNLDVNLFW